MRALARRAGADLEIERVTGGLVHQAMAIRDVRLEARAVARLQQGLALILDQHDLAFQHVNELVLLFVPMAQRRGSTGLQPREVHAELSEAYRIAERSFVPAGAHLSERRRIIRGADAGLKCCEV